MIIRSLKIFGNRSESECYYYVGLSPSDGTISIINQFREELQLGVSAGNMLGPAMPLLGFPVANKYQKVMKEMVGYELKDLENTQLAEVGQLHCEANRGLIGFQLHLSQKLSETIYAIKHQLVDLFDVDSRYLKNQMTPCLIIIKNLGPIEFKYACEKAADLNISQFDFSHVALNNGLSFEKITCNDKQIIE
ncbi:hypothetical protein GC194_09875 [bacterium]|nr:hypothetical protein [bacterium]